MTMTKLQTQHFRRPEWTFHREF